MLTFALFLPLIVAEPQPADLPAKAEVFIAALAKGDYAAAGKDFGPAMQKALPADKMQSLWETLSAPSGTPPFLRTRPSAKP